jgi:hypothetical protein
LHFENALLEIDCKDSGNVISDNEGQFKNALYPIFVILAGTTTVSILLQYANA